MQRKRTKLLSGNISSSDAPIDTLDKATKRVIAPYVKVIRKSERGRRGKEQVVQEPVKFNFYVQNKPSVLLEDLSSFLSDSVDLVILLHETSEVLKSTTKANGN